MLDLKYVVENLDEVKNKLSSRQMDTTYLDQLKQLSERRKNLILDVEKNKAFRNEQSKKIGLYKRENKDVNELLEEIGNLGEVIKKQDQELEEINVKIETMLLETPNIPHESVPFGKDENDNVVIRKYLEPTQFTFEPKDHVELGEKLGLFDFERAAKVTGTRFVFDKGLGARLERALLQFMMDTHAINHHYEELIAPYIINEKSMYATGQLPKFRDDAFEVLGGSSKWYLNPTAEVPTINFYRDEILDNEILPKKFVSYTTAFRAEAGSAGRDTRGILRQHQFHKVELIRFTRPEESYQALEEMILESEMILKLLKIPYQVVSLSTGDLGFSMAKTYDIEVWLPGQNKYREIGSISNAEDYQARRANIRFKRTKDAKTEYVHTLNGSGLAIGRTIIAVIENYQNEDGTITVPEVLIPYMKTNTIK